MINNFRTIMEKYGTTKTVYYCEPYEECLNDIRKDIKLVFEIGVNDGASVKGFKEYFPNAIIVGIDINPKCKQYEENSIKIEIGNASNKEFIDILLKKYGSPDIVIDDGSHISTDIISSYELLFSQTKICYIMEDLDTQYGLHGPEYTPKGISAIPLINKNIDEIMKSNKLLKSIKIYFPIVFIFKK